MADLMDRYQKLKDAGNGKFKLKDYQAAKKLYSEAIKAKQDEPLAYLNRAACNINLKLFYEAIEDCNCSLELDANLFKAYYRRATALRELSRLNLARADYEKASELDPNSPLVRDALKELDNIIDQSQRLDVHCYKKPDNLCSKKSLQTFELNNQYSGARKYDLEDVK